MVTTELLGAIYLGLAFGGLVHKTPKPQPIPKFLKSQEAYPKGGGFIIGMLE